MASVNDPDYLNTNDDQSQGSQNEPTQPNTGSGSAPGSVSVNSAGQNPSINVSPGSAPMAPTVSHARKASTGFTNLKSYLGANQNNKLGQNIASNAQTKIDDTKQTLQDNYADYQNKLANETAKYGGVQDSSNKALQYVDTGNAPVAEYDNTKAATDLANLKKYLYGGPQEINNLQKVVQNQSEINDIARNTQTDAGRGALLQNQYGHSGQYTSGARNLDNLLLSNNHESLDALRGVRANANQLQSTVQNTANQAAAQKASIQNRELQDQTAQLAAMKNLRDSLKTRLEGQAVDYNTAQTADANELTDDEFNRLFGQSGYETTTDFDPATGAINDGIHIGGKLPPGMTPKPGTTQWVNLMNNSALSADQQYDPNKTYTQNRITQGDTFGQPGTDDTQSLSAKSILAPVMLKKDAFRDFYSQKYDTPTEWTGVDQDALARRNVLSNVLEDQGAVAGTAKNTVQDVIDNNKLDSLKALPKLAQDKYADAFLNNDSLERFARTAQAHPEMYGLTHDQIYRILQQENTIGNSFGETSNDYDKASVAKLAQNVALNNYLKQQGLNPDDYKFTYRIPRFNSSYSKGNT